MPGFHYNVIASNDQFPDSFKCTTSKQFSLSCLLTFLRLLIGPNLTKTILRGEIMKKYDEAVIYNSQRHLNVTNFPKYVIL